MPYSLLIIMIILKMSTFSIFKNIIFSVVISRNLQIIYKYSFYMSRFVFIVTVKLPDF
jgi:hypothetical protein